MRPCRIGAAILLVVTFLAACGGTADLGAAIAGPHCASPTHVAEPPTRESMAAAPDYRDCNHDALDGRETDVKTSDANCGACGHACNAGHCELGTCIAP